MGEKFIEPIKYFGGVEAYLKNEKEISALFKGYPEFFIGNFLDKYDDENIVNDIQLDNTANKSKFT